MQTNRTGQNSAGEQKEMEEFQKDMIRVRDIERERCKYVHTCAARLCALDIKVH